jgi:hypothetical protein
MQVPLHLPYSSSFSYVLPSLTAFSSPPTWEDMRTFYSQNFQYPKLCLIMPHVPITVSYYTPPKKKKDSGHGSSSSSSSSSSESSNSTASHLDGESINTLATNSSASRPESYLDDPACLGANAASRTRRATSYYHARYIKFNRHLRQRNVSSWVKATKP